MRRFEVLSQASAISVNAGQPLFLTSAHVVQPMNWRNYYPQEWMDFVKPEHVKITLDVSGCGDKTTHYDVDCSALRAHPFRDCCAMVLEPHEVRRYLEGEVHQRVTPVILSPNLLQPDDASVTVAGHAIVDCLERIRDDGLRPQRPDTGEGCTLIRRTDAQSFLRTPHVLVEGMCGGGLMDPSTDSCFGMIEGIVPTGGGNELAGACAFIESAELLTWVNLGCPSREAITKELETRRQAK